MHDSGTVMRGSRAGLCRRGGDSPHQVAHSTSRPTANARGLPVSDDRRMKLVKAPATDLFDTFFARETTDVVGVRLSRIREVERRLRDCLEREAERVFVTDDLARLAVERSAEPVGAAARIADGEDLVFLLNLFLREPWLADDPTDRRVQFRVIEHFTAWLISRRHVDSYGLECPLLDLRYALDSGRRALRASVAAAR